MSKPPVAQRPAIPHSQLPPRSAWAKGPPQTVSSSSSPRSQSPALANQNPGSPQNVTSQTTSHSRRPSTLSGEPVAVDPSVSRNAPIKTGSMQFGSIDQPPVTPAPAAAPAPTHTPSLPSINPASSPAQKLKSFGTIPNSNLNGTTPSPTPTPPLQPPSIIPSQSSSPAPSSGTSTPAKSQRAKIDVKKFFQGGGAPAPSSATPSPAHHTVPIPPPGAPSNFTPHPTPQLPPQVQGTYSPYSPATANRPLSSSHPSAANGPQGNANAVIPRSPSFQRQLSNGSPSPAPGQTPRSPRIPLATPAIGPGPPSTPGPGPGGAPQMHFGQQQAPHMMWGYYPYGYDQQYMAQAPPQYPYAPPTYGHMPPPPHHQQHPPQHPPQHPQQHPPSQHSHQHPPHLQPTPHPHSPHLAPAHPNPSSSTMSPRTMPPPLSSAPPASPSLSSPATAGLRSNAATFVPRSRTVTIKDASGKEIDLRNPSTAHKRESSLSFSTPATIAPPVVASGSNLSGPDKKKPTAIRLESEQERKARLEKEKREKEEQQRKKDEQEKERRRKVEEEKERLRLEEEERVKKEKEEEERKKREEQERIIREEERIRKEEEDRRKKDEEDRLRREEEERKKREEEERFRIQKEEEEKARLKKEEEDREKERLRLEEEEKEKIRKEQEAEAERERLRLEEEAAKAKAEEQKRLAEEAASAAVAATADTKSTTAVTPPPPSTSPATPTVTPRRRPVPGPLDLTSAQRPGLPAPLPSALATARIISNLDDITYPEGIKSPKIELNQNAKGGKFKYDRDFLLQFMQICKEKPDNLPPLDAIGIEPVEGTVAPGMHRERSQRRSISQNMPPQQQPGRPAIGVGIPPFNQFNKQPARMGEFAMGPGSTQMRHVTVPSGLSGVPFPNKQPALTRPPSSGGPNGLPTQAGLGGDRRHRGSRNAKNRTDANRVNSMPPPNNMQPPLEPVVQLQPTENRWTASSLVASRRGHNIDESSHELLDKKVKSLLNKLTMEKFDSISDQIIEWANKSEKETDGRTLMRVIRLVFEKATDEATWSEMYARLCRKMHEKISPGVIDESIKTQEGKPFAGGQLFRKYLLNRCQDDFERGWQKKDAAEAAAAAKAESDKAAETATAEGEEVLYSEEYYQAQKAKRQGLGLVKFIGELFKLQMLTERIMHQCIKKLLSNVDNPAEEEIESLCKLLTTVGEQLDSPKAKNHMDVYFARMKELAASPKIASRMQYMLLDVIELRQRRWSTRHQAAAPTTLAAVHEQAARDKEKAAANVLPMSRGGSRRGGDARTEFSQVGADGWTTAGGAANAPRPQPAKVGDLTMFGKINKSGPASFGPSAAFKKDAVKRESGNLSRTASSSNMYAALAGGGDASSEPPLSRGSQPPSRKPSADFTQTGIPDAAGLVRRRLKLLPRTIPVASEDAKDEDSAGGESPPAQSDESEQEDGEIREGEDDDIAVEIPTMSEEDAQRKIKEDVKELFSIRNLDEAEQYFRALPPQHHKSLVDKILGQVMDLKEKDAQFIASYFAQVKDKQLCTPADFEEGFAGTMEFLEDISVDVPAAYKLMAIVIDGAQLSQDALERLAERIAVEGEPFVSPRDKLLREIEKLSS